MVLHPARPWYSALRYRSMEEPHRQWSRSRRVSPRDHEWRTHLSLIPRDGKKMSKSLKNYPDPNDIINKYGADCVRLFLVNSPVVRGENLRFREEGVREILANVILKWINSLNFYLGQVELFEQTTGEKFMYNHDAPKSTNVMDRWILATCQSLIQHVDEEMAGQCRNDWVR